MVELEAMREAVMEAEMVVKVVDIILLALIHILIPPLQDQMVVMELLLMVVTNIHNILIQVIHIMGLGRLEMILHLGLL